VRFVRKAMGTTSFLTISLDMSDQHGAHHRKAPDHDLRAIRKAAAEAEARPRIQGVGLFFLYLALFLCALATYSTLLLHKLHGSHFAYGTALLNALIMSKIKPGGRIFPTRPHAVATGTTQW
jgi:hypothetical protein